jgi:hypothetical protein
MQQQTQYFSVEDLIGMIDSPNKEACEKILADNRKLFQLTQGSKHNHQAWSGGYFDHIQEIMNIAYQLYHTFDALRPLPFSLSDAILVVYLHDIEKPWKYALNAEGNLDEIEELRDKEAQHKFRAKKLAEYGVSLSPEQENGMRYVEGEIKDYSGWERKMGPLATLCHMADVASARIWFEHPMVEGDSWNGAARNRK